MSLRAEWSALARRIQGLTDAAKFVSQAKFVRPPAVVNASNSADDEISRIATKVTDDLVSFCHKHKKDLPGIIAPIFFYKGGFDSHLRSDITKMMTALMLVKSEVDYLLADTQAVARSLTERAFAHLQRSIIADEEIRAKWQKAYAASETACERLGATHLLAHGIWAFKANSAGERTDLVLGEKICDPGKIERMAEGLVLTEWKLIRTVTGARRTAAQALRQARKYASGSLGGFELRSPRYIVLVSKDLDLDYPPETAPDGELYRYICLRVAPSAPSKIKPGRAYKRS